MVAMIRPLTGSDAESFRALRLRGLQEDEIAFLTSYATEAAKNAEEAHATFRARLSPTNVIFGAFDEAGAFGDAGALIGVVGVRKDDYPKKPHKAHIWGMYVAPEARGIGLGRDLMDEAISYARAMPGIERLELAVWADNPSAVRLYQGLGFVAWGREPQALKIDGVHYDDLWMSLEL